MDVGRDSLIAGCVLAIAVLAFPLNTRPGNQEHDKAFGRRERRAVAGRSFRPGREPGDSRRPRRGVGAVRGGPWCRPI